jgi:hypothetical protein
MLQQSCDTSENTSNKQQYLYKSGAEPFNILVVMIGTNQQRRKAVHHE